MSSLSFSVGARDPKSKARTGVLTTLNGVVQTPAFVPVGTKAAVKGVTPEQLQALGAQIVLANTYHLYLQPGEEVVKAAGGLAKFMGWSKDGKLMPTMTDSGGFQVFSLGAGFGKTIFKVAPEEEVRDSQNMTVYDEDVATQHGQLAVIDDEGVTFTSHHNGSLHRFTPERSVEIQHALGADIFFAFDECTSLAAPYAYQREAMERTHRWAVRSIKAHRQNLEAQQTQAIFGVLQGGPHQDLRTESAKEIASMGFDGFGVGGSFSKEGMNEMFEASVPYLPEDKPRHFLGIGEPGDILIGISQGMDLFDCVAATRQGRHGTIYTKRGPTNLKREEFKNDFTALDPETQVAGTELFTRGYVSHLLRAGEFLGQTIASLHNLGFIIQLVDGAREAIENGTFAEYRESFERSYYQR
jgi:queuine tRNA-ribosyltransferase